MTADAVPDVMQVCLNGHVITDLLHTHPEQALDRCDRCGAATLHRCATCGRDLPGAIPVPGLVPIGHRRPPVRCPTCGASFPWTERPAPPSSSPLAVLETLLRRVPLVIRRLRARHGTRPPFQVEDVYDLEDLVRSVLPLHFDDVRPECRTPGYAAETRQDFVLAPERIALTVKHVTPEVTAQCLAEQLQEDVAYYAQQRAGVLVGFIYDPEERLPEPRRFEVACSRGDGELDVRCVVAW